MDSNVNIYLDCRSLNKTGSARYVDELFEHIQYQDSKIRLFRYFRNNSSIFKNSKLGLALDCAFEYALFGIELSKKRCDLFHCTKNFGVPHGGDFAVVTTVHDIIPLEMRSAYSNTLSRYLYFSYNYNLSLKRSNSIIVISKFTYSRLKSLYPNFSKKIILIPQGCDSEFGCKINLDESLHIMSNLGVVRPYILTMGGAEPRKNIEMLVRLYNENSTSLPFDLVIIGGKWGQFTVPTPANRSSQFHCLVGLSESELVAAYNSAICFVFPSIYEGFGLPVLEAMACGTPVLAHNGTSIPEVAGNAAMLVDMRNPQECLAALKKLLTDSILREELVKAGYERVKMFSWEKTAAQTLEVYKSVL